MTTLYRLDQDGSYRPTLAARSGAMSRRAPRPQGCVARASRSARIGWARQYESTASRGVGGTKGRPSAQDRTGDGKMRGSALLRRASDRRFFSAFSACHSDIFGLPDSDGMVPTKPKGFVTGVATAARDDRPLHMGDGSFWLHLRPLPLVRAPAEADALLTYQWRKTRTPPRHQQLLPPAIAQRDRRQPGLPAQ